MMRGQRHMAVAVRAPDGSITVHEEPLNGALYRHPLMKLPVLRGLVALWDALGLGMKALMYSAEVSLQEEATPETVEKSAVGAAATTALPTAPATPTGQAGTPAQKAFSGPVAWTSIAFALGLMITIFFVLPVLAAGLVTGLANVRSSATTNIV